MVGVGGNATGRGEEGRPKAGEGTLDVEKLALRLGEYILAAIECTDWNPGDAVCFRRGTLACTAGLSDIGVPGTARCPGELGVNGGVNECGD